MTTSNTSPHKTETIYTHRNAAIGLGLGVGGAFAARAALQRWKNTITAARASESQNKSQHSTSQNTITAARASESQNKSQHSTSHSTSGIDPCYCGIAFSQHAHVIVDGEHLSKDTLCYGLPKQMFKYEKTETCTTYCEGQYGPGEILLNFLNSITYMMIMSTKVLQRPETRLEKRPEDKLRVTKISIDMPSERHPTAKIVAELHWNTFFSFEVKMTLSLIQNGTVIDRLEQDNTSDRTRDYDHSRWDDSYITWFPYNFQRNSEAFKRSSERLVPFLDHFKRPADDDELRFGAVEMIIERKPRDPESTIYRNYLTPHLRPGPVHAGIFEINRTEDTMPKQRCRIDNLKARLIMLPLLNSTK